MKGEDTLKFTNSIILLSKLLSKIEDRFFARKLYEKVSDFVSAFVEQRTSPFSTSHNISPDLLNSINNLLDHLDYLKHDSKLDSASLFLAQRNLLKFKLHILKKKNDIPAIIDAATSKLAKPKPKLIRLILKSNSNKERIFNFVKDTPDVRTKDIMDEFRTLSGRTIKRNLKELTDEGFLRKRSEESGAVYYLPADLN